MGREKETKKTSSSAAKGNEKKSAKKEDSKKSKPKLKQAQKNWSPYGKVGEENTEKKAYNYYGKNIFAKNICVRREKLDLGSCSSSCWEQITLSICLFCQSTVVTVLSQCYFSHPFSLHTSFVRMCCTCENTVHSPVFLLLLLLFLMSSCHPLSANSRSSLLLSGPRSCVGGSWTGRRRRRRRRRQRLRPRDPPKTFGASNFISASGFSETSIAIVTLKCVL